MKKYLFIMIMAIVPSLLMAQAAGGAIKRQTNNKQKMQQPKSMARTNAATPKVRASTAKPAEDNVYNVKFSCNAPFAVVFIDGKADGSLNEIHLLKTGTHYVTLKADGYEPSSQNIVVNSSSTSFTFNLKKDFSTLPLVIQRLINNSSFASS